MASEEICPVVAKSGCEGVKSFDVTQLPLLMWIQQVICLCFNFDLVVRKPGAFWSQGTQLWTSRKNNKKTVLESILIRTYHKRKLQFCSQLVAKVNLTKNVMSICNETSLKNVGS
jgi:hypothetical protein